MNINVRSILHIVSLSIPFLKMTKGNIVCISSTAGLKPEPGATLYCTSKAMLNMMVKCVSLEYASKGIRCNAVAPGFTATLARQVSSKEYGMQLVPEENKMEAKKAYESIPLQSINHPDDIADSVIWLSSNEASIITGEILVVDGGQHLTSNSMKTLYKEVIVLHRIQVQERQ